MEKQSEVVGELMEKALELVNNDHMERARIQEMARQAEARLAVLRERAELRGKKLADSRTFYSFLRKVYDIKAWVKEKTQVALDESYLELANLQNKIQKQAGFEAEVTANRSRLEAVNLEGDELCSRSHFASQEIAGQLEELGKEWQHLQDTSR